MSTQELAQQANDLLNRLTVRQRELYRAAPSMPYATFRHEQARVARIMRRSFARLERRLDNHQRRVGAILERTGF